MRTVLPARDRNVSKRRLLSPVLAIPDIRDSRRSSTNAQGDFMRRRDFIKVGGAAGLLANTRGEAAAVHNFDRYDFGPGPAVANRLFQGPFPTDRFAGWQVVMATTASNDIIPAFGMGLVTYLC